MNGKQKPGGQAKWQETKCTKEKMERVGIKTIGKAGVGIE